MSSNLEFETFFYISSDKLSLSVFKKGLVQDFYKDEIKLNKDLKILDTSINQFLDKNICKSCNGSRLKKESMYFKIDDMNINHLSNMDLIELSQWFEKIESKLSDKDSKISEEIIKEIRVRINFLLDVGLEYLSLSSVQIMKNNT